jgi:hypothetical protein
VGQAGEIKPLELHGLKDNAGSHQAGS